MRGLMPNQVRLGVTLLRVVVASVFVIHGITRLMNGGVAGFGGFEYSVLIASLVAVALADSASYRLGSSS
jgi:uncharacterized membrane protein YphA (DoxX/SURF4 family)